MKAYEVACESVWAITEEALSALLAISLRQGEESWEALAARLGKPVEYSHFMTMRDGIATIPIDGPIFRKANLMTRYSGASSYDVLAYDLGRALDDPAIRGVLLSVDSPGGMLEGTSELATLIRSARGHKPVWAHGWGSVASAAYWLASAAERVTVAPTALLGSIGVVAVHRDRLKDGEVQFVSSVSPHKRFDPASDESRREMQKKVDRLGEVFVATVAEHRGLSPEKVLSDFGRGSCLVGSDAVAAGMADAVSTYEATHAALAAEVARPRISFFPVPAVPLVPPALKIGA